MKRSEMINLMVDTFHEGMNSKEELLSGMSDEQADRILTAMENAGMLPPETDILESLTLGQGLTITSIKKGRQWDA